METSKPQVELTYLMESIKGQHEDYQKIVGEMENVAAKIVEYETKPKIVYSFSGDASAFHARNLMTEVLEKSSTLPLEAATVYDLIEGKSSAEIDVYDRKRMTETLDKQIKLLKFIGNIQTVNLKENDYVRDLKEKGYVSTHYTGDEVLVRFDRTDTKELELQKRILEEQAVCFDKQFERIITSLEKVPKSQMFIDNIRYAEDRNEQGCEVISIFNVPKPVADWLPEIWQEKQKKTLGRDWESNNLSKIELLIARRGWEPEYRKSENFPRDQTKRKDIIKNLIEEGRKGILYGITDLCHYNWNPHYSISRIDFEEEKANIEKELKEQIDKLTKKQESLNARA